jgi:hypothetical protein
VSHRSSEERQRREDEEGLDSEPADRYLARGGSYMEVDDKALSEAHAEVFDVGSNYLAVPGAQRGTSFRPAGQHARIRAISLAADMYRGSEDMGERRSEAEAQADSVSLRPRASSDMRARAMSGDDGVRRRHTRSFRKSEYRIILSGISTGETNPVIGGHHVLPEDRKSMMMPLELRPTYVEGASKEAGEEGERNLDSMMNNEEHRDYKNKHIFRTSFMAGLRNHFHFLEQDDAALSADAKESTARLNPLSQHVGQAEQVLATVASKFQECLEEAKKKEETHDKEKERRWALRERESFRKRTKSKLLEVLEPLKPSHKVPPGGPVKTRRELQEEADLAERRKAEEREILRSRSMAASSSSSSSSSMRGFSFRKRLNGLRKSFSMGGSKKQS